MTSTVGNPRILRLVELLEADDWLMLLYLTRDVIPWGEMRVQEPHLARWAGGEPMTIEDRAASETVRVRERCQLLGKRWLHDRGSFLSRLRLLVELSSHASEAAAARFGVAQEVMSHSAAFHVARVLGLLGPRTPVTPSLNSVTKTLKNKGKTGRSSD